jgi:hypothetical protein
VKSPIKRHRALLAPSWSTPSASRDDIHTYLLVGRTDATHR